MMALSRKMLEHEAGEIELLLPWYAAGTLSPRDMQRVEEALAGDPELARQYAAIQQEYAETIALNESLGAPSLRAMQKLFAAIDAEPEQQAVARRGLGARITAFFASLTPRTVAWSVSLGALLVLVQAGIIGAVLTKSQTATYQTASLSTTERARSNEPLTRALGPVAAPMHALVRFAPDARVADITTLLDTYQASIVDGAKGGLFRLQFGDRAMSKDEADSLIGRLQREKIVSLAVAAP
jgi:anti-sigma-K factor RskA